MGNMTFLEAAGAGGLAAGRAVRHQRRAPVLQAAALVPPVPRRNQRVSGQGPPRRMTRLPAPLAVQHRTLLAMDRRGLGRVFLAHLTVLHRFTFRSSISELFYYPLHNTIFRKIVGSVLVEVYRLLTGGAGEEQSGWREDHAVDGRSYVTAGAGAADDAAVCLTENGDLVSFLVVSRAGGGRALRLAARHGLLQPQGTRQAERVATW